MKSPFSKYNTFYFLMIAVLFNLHSVAQDTSVTTRTTTSTTENVWYMQPWAWMAGGAILLVILIGLLSGRKKPKPVTQQIR